MRDFQHIDRIDRIGHVLSNPLFERVSMVGAHWTCLRTVAKTTAGTTEGDSNTRIEVTSA